MSSTRVLTLLYDSNDSILRGISAHLYIYPIDDLKNTSLMDFSLSRPLAILDPYIRSIPYRHSKKAWVELCQQSQGFSPPTHPSRRLDVINGRHGHPSSWLPWVVVSASGTCSDIHHKCITIMASNGSSLISWPCCSLAYHFLSSRSPVREIPYRPSSHERL